MPVFFSSLAHGACDSWSSSYFAFRQSTRILKGLSMYHIITMYKSDWDGFQAHATPTCRDVVMPSGLCLWWHCDPGSTAGAERGFAK